MQTSIPLLTGCYSIQLSPVLVISILHNPFCDWGNVLFSLRLQYVYCDSEDQSHEQKWWFCILGGKKGGFLWSFPILTPCCLTFVTFLSFPMLSLHPPAPPLPSSSCFLDITLALVCHLFFSLQESQKRKFTFVNILPKGTSLQISGA